MRARRLVAAIWICFLLRAAFYSAMLPLWEGYDEWGHFAVIRTLVNSGQWLIGRQPPVTRDVAASLRLAPAPYELRDYPAPTVTHDVFWKLPPEERAR